MTEHWEPSAEASYEVIAGPCPRRMKRGWRCTRRRHYSGPCALVPCWWNWTDDAVRYRLHRWFRR